MAEVHATTLFVTHNIAEAIFLADHVMVMTPHPGRLAAVVDVPFGRPRDIELQQTPEFNALVSEVRGILGPLMAVSATSARVAVAARRNNVWLRRVVNHILIFAALIAAWEAGRLGWLDPLTTPRPSDIAVRSSRSMSTRRTSTGTSW